MAKESIRGDLSYDMKLYEAYDVFPSPFKQRSLRALRKLLIAFRSAVHMNEDDQNLMWRIDNSSGSCSLFSSLFAQLHCALVYNKLVTTALRYTPMVLTHHVPYKTLPNGKLYVPSNLPIISLRE